jgi:hypothetical protein
MSAAANRSIAVDIQRRSQRRANWGYLAIVGLAFVTLGLYSVHGGSILNLAFPVMSFVLAGILYVYHRPTYIAFTWWIWLASPEVRRLVDFQTAYHSISPVMLSPLLVTSIAFIQVLRRPGYFRRRKVLPFSLFAFVTVFALSVGIFQNGFLSAAYDWAQWINPLAFGILFMQDSANIEANKKAFFNAVMVGLLLIGAYGIYQFFRLPPWDAFWMQQSNLHSIGQALVEQVRIFGPLNSPGAYGAVLAASLAFVLVAKGPLRIAAAVAGFPAFALCEVRSAWGMWAVAAVFILLRMQGRSRARLVFAAAIIAIFVAPILAIGPISTITSSRFSSISNLKNDRSANVREQLYISSFEAAFSNPIGLGTGGFGSGAKLSAGNVVVFDSGLLEFPYEFGWAGGLIFLWAITLVVIAVLNVYFKTRDPIAIAAAGVFMGLVAGLIFGQTLEGVSGVMLWACVGLLLDAPISRKLRVTYNRFPNSGLAERIS